MTKNTHLILGGIIFIILPVYLNIKFYTDTKTYSGDAGVGNALGFGILNLPGALLRYLISLIIYGDHPAPIILNNITITIVSIITYFVIGALCGWAIYKFKNRNITN